MSTTDKNIVVEFQDLYLELDRETQKALNEWSQQNNNANLPKWFGSDATSDEKALLIEAMKDNDLSGYGIDSMGAANSEEAKEAFEEMSSYPPVTHCEHGVPIAKDCDHCSEEVNREADEEDEQRISPTVFDKKLSDDDLKHLLEKAGYKPQLVPDSRDIDVTLNVTMKVPASLKTDEEVTNWIEGKTMDIEFTVGDTIYSPTFTEWDDA